MSYVSSKPNRHSHGEELQADSSGRQRPCVVLKFNKDPDRPSQEAHDERQKLRDAIQRTGMQVEESESRDADEQFFKVSARDEVLEVIAQAMELPLRLRQKYGGTMMPFERRYKKMFEQSSERTLFSSLNQCRLIEFNLQRSKNNGGVGIEFGEELENACDFDSYYYLHYDPMRRRLLENWGKRWASAQPIEEIKEYYGEKIGLYFVWLGHYTSSLFMPAALGVILTASQLVTSVYTGSMDNPWVPLYCIFTALWAVYFLESWKRIEATKRYQWETMDFEEQEEDRDEFWGETRENPITGEDETYFPDWKRGIRIGVSVAIVFSFISAVIFTVSGIMVFKMLAKEWFGMLGAPLGGVTNAMSIMIFNIIYGKVVEALTNFENWRTETEWEDSLIAKDFVFKFVNAYFALFFVAFVQNNVAVYGFDLHCDHYHCMPVLTMTLGIVFGTQIFVQQSLEIGMPIIKARLRDWQERRELRKKGILDVKPMTPEEEQAKLEDYEGTFDDYQEMVVQFGYVTLFAAAFPMTAVLALLNNIVEIRVDALKLLTATKRPRYMCAADIGTWHTILNILATAAIMTNVCLVGFTSHGLYLYFPDMSHVERIWITIICEHVLILFKIVVESVIPDVPREVEIEYEKGKHELKKAISGGVKHAPDAGFETDFA